MMIAAIVGGVLFVCTVSFAILVRWRTSWLRAQPEPYPREVLAKDPDGVEELIRCPDGTQLRAVSRGTGPATVVFLHGTVSTSSSGTSSGLSLASSAIGSSPSI